METRQELEKQDMVKVMVDDDVSADLIEVYLNIAKSKILNRLYPYSPEETHLPAKYDALHVEATAYLINKRGVEGQLSHHENGVVRVYESASLPPSMLKEIVPYVGVIK